MSRFSLSPRAMLAAAAALGVVILGVVFALLQSGSDDPVAGPTTTSEVSTTSSTPSTTTTAPSTTTSTTLPGGPQAPLTGLGTEDESLLDRRVMGVKIDNHPLARPQSGLDRAEAVYEIVVEGGLTRFLALFHTTDSEYLGPMRSGRPTDATILKPYGGAFAISGASHWIRRDLLNNGIDLLGEGRGTFRISSRNAPHNLYVNTSELRDVADQRDISTDPPPAAWNFGPLPEDATMATTITAVFTRTVEAEWVWDGEAYARSTNGSPHLLLDTEGAESSLLFDGVIILRVEQYTARPPSPADGQPVPASNTVGTGGALVFAEGHMVEGSWSRESDGDVFSLTTSAGDVLTVPPGRYWIALVPTSGSVDWS